MRTILDITSLDRFSLNKPKEYDFIIIYHKPVLEAGQQSTTLSHQITPPCSFLNFLPLYLKSMIWRSITKHTLLLADLIITYLCCITLRVILIGFIWYNLQWDILVLISWFNYFKYIIMNEKILLIRQRTIRFFRNSN